MKWLIAITVALLASPRLVAADPAATEVVIVSTQHFITDMPDGYTPAHLRALLHKIAPAAILVEAAHNVPDPWQTAPYELSQVTRPWAAERNLPVIPAGWDESAYQSQLGTMFQDFQRAGHVERYNQIETRFQTALTKRPMTCAEMNSARCLGLWREYHAGLHELYGKDTPWEVWNAKIAERVTEVCRDRAGRRVAVVFGGAHAYFLTDRLAKEKSLRVIPAESFFPLSEEDVRAHTKDEDYVRAMRLLNFPPGALSGQQLADLQAKLDRLKPIEKYRNDFQYFTARLLFHQRKPNEAATILAKLSALPADVLLAFDATTPVRDAARAMLGARGAAP